MRIGKSQFPFDGFVLYKSFHKTEKRYYVTLVRPGFSNKWMTFSRYLMCVKLGRVLNRNEEVDHINGDKTDDSIDNLQILSPYENKSKSSFKGGVPEYICPVCEKVFKPLRKQSAKI